MSDSIKKRIMDRFLANLAPFKQTYVLASLVLVDPGTGYLDTESLQILGGTEIEPGLVNVNGVGGAGEITDTTIITPPGFSKLPANPVYLQGLTSDSAIATATATWTPVPTFVRSITRELDPLKSSDALPALMIYDEPENELEQDFHGRTYEFMVTFKLLFTSQRDLPAEKDRLVPELQKIIESDVQLGGLANIVDGGAEQPFINELGKPVGLVFVSYQVKYRRVLGDPFTTY